MCEIVFYFKKKKQQEPSDFVDSISLKKCGYFWF